MGVRRVLSRWESIWRMAAERRECIRGRVDGVCFSVLVDSLW